MEFPNNVKSGCNDAVIGNSTNDNGIKEFYKDAVIFITGGTGFLGKALIEKLLRTCTEIKAIYIHVRSKRGLSSEARYREYVRHRIFNRLKAENPAMLDKLVCIPGDIRQPRLGINDEHMEMILQNVTIVFHSAATVKFNEPLQEAVELNALGTERLMIMCMKMSKLKSFVHVSTAFSNPAVKHVAEAVYPTTFPLNKNTFMKFVRILKDGTLNSMLDYIKGPHPNTYTLTKSIAEIIVSEYSNQFPVAIVRPSIITSAVADPYPGWIDNIQGITGIMMEIGRGTLTSILGEGKLICDIMPVDIVVNTVICAAWRGCTYNDNRTHVYNCTSGQINPTTNEQLSIFAEKWSRIYPSKYLMMYPKCTFRTNRISHIFYHFLFHYFPSQAFDLLLRLRGSKPIMIKMLKKLQMSCETGKFFVSNEWVFDNRNQMQLIKEVDVATDGDQFSCDVSKLDYDVYVKDYILGIRRYVLNDSDESLKKSRKKLSKIYRIRTTFHFALTILLLYVVVKCISLVFFRR